MADAAGPVSQKLFSEAKQILPGGVSSPVRAISPSPFYVKSADGSKLFTEDGKTYIDCCLGYGPLLLGHKNPVIAAAAAKQLESGWLFGTPSALEVTLAKKSLLTIHQLRCSVLFQPDVRQRCLPCGLPAVSPENPVS